MMKKLLVSLLVGLSFGTVVNAQTKVDKPHTECFMHPVLVGKDVKENPYTKKLYTITAYYDGITGFRINTEVETIYIDDDDNRWYFPFDDDKYHKHEGIRMSFEKGYEEE